MGYSVRVWNVTRTSLEKPIGRFTFVSQAIIKAIAERTSVAELPKEWQFISPDPQVRAVAYDALGLLSSLRDAFSDDELVEANIAGTDADGQSILIGALDLDPLVLQTVQSAGQLIDLTSPKGSVLSALPPSFDAPRDEVVHSRCKEWADQIIVAPAAPEIVLMSALGLPVVPSTGLEHLTVHDLKLLLGEPGEESHSDVKYMDSMAPIRKSADQIVLMPWTFDEPEVDIASDILGVISFLRQMKKHFRFDTSIFSVWDISARSREALLAAKACRSEELVVHALKSSLRLDTKALDYFEERGSHLPRDFRNARESLIRQLKRSRLLGFVGSRTKSAAEDFEAALEETVILPILDQAAAPLTEPLNRPLLLMLANLLQQMTRYDPILRKFESLKSGKRDSGADQDLAWLMQLQPAVLDLHKALTRRRNA